MSEPLVWLPFDPAEPAGEDGRPPGGLRYETVDPTVAVPDSVGDVEVFVPPYSVRARAVRVMSRMTSLRVVQTLTAGVDTLRGAVPDGVLLCSGRGIHDASTAELALTLTLASLRGVPDFVRAQGRRSWDFRWRPSLADRRVLLVGYGAIGAAVESRFSPFECEVVRVARTSRDGVHAIEELPEQFRMAVLLADVEGFSYKEIAEILDIPIGTVMSRLHRGRSRLQKALYDFAVDRGLTERVAEPATTPVSGADT